MMRSTGSELGSASQEHERLNQVEEVILAKVQQRTPQRMNEDTFIVKTFRFHDLGSSGFCDLQTFKRAFGPFTSGIADQDLQAIFQRYCPRGPLNYKIFAAEFVDGVRRQPDLIPDANQDTGETAEDALLRIKDFLCCQGPRGIIGLATKFREADPENSRTLTYSALQALVSEFFGGGPCQVREEQVDQIFDLFRQQYAPDSLVFDEFIGALLDELTPERRDTIRAAWRRLDTNSEGLVDMAHVTRSFNVNRHPQVSDGSRQPEEVLQEFTETLHDAIAFRRGQRSFHTSLVAWEEFEDYYKLVNGSYADDAFFCSMVQKVWDVDKAPNKAIDARAVLARPAAGIPAKSRAGLHHWQSDTLPTNVTHHNVDACVSVDELMLRARQQVARRGLRAAVGVAESFYAADDDMDDLVDAYEFRRACQQAGLAFRDAEEARLFEVCGAGPSSGAQRGGVGKLSVPRFLQLLQGPLSDTRRAAVERAWAALGGDPNNESSAVSPAVLKERFAAESHPLVTRGELESVAVAAEFLDTFSLLAHVRGGCQNGMVAFFDFLAYYEVVSSTIDNDAFFDLLLHRLWSLPPDQGGGCNGPPFGRLAHAASPLRDRRPPAHSGPSAYQRPGGLGEGCQDSPSKLDTHRRFLRKEGDYPDQVQPPTAPCFSAITKSSIVFDEAGSGELGTVLRRFRESLAKRGVKGWRNLAQRFQQHDHRKNGTVLRLDWERLHRTLGLGLSPEDREVLFRGFAAGRRDGTMDYRACLQSLCGSLPERRQALVERLFDALREGQPDVPTAVLKSGFDAQNSPPCLLGRSSAEQAAQDFYEAVDFFGGERGFDPDRFVELFRIFSALYPEEDEFRLITTAAFGLSATGIGQGGA